MYGKVCREKLHISDSLVSNRQLHTVSRRGNWKRRLGHDSILCHIKMMGEAGISHKVEPRGLFRGCSPPTRRGARDHEGIGARRNDAEIGRTQDCAFLSKKQSAETKLEERQWVRERRSQLGKRMRQGRLTYCTTTRTGMTTRRDLFEHT